MTYDVFVYGKNEADFTGTGLCGGLFPISCEHEEIAGGMSAVTLTHPFDPQGKWRNLQHGNILSCMTRVRTTPEIDEGGQVVTSVETWTVKQSATQNERKVYTKKSGGRAKGKPLPKGQSVTVVLKPEGAQRYKIKTGRISGWVNSAALDYDTTEAITDIEEKAAPWVIREQLFRIQSIRIDTEGGTVTAYAPHISYDLLSNNTRYKADGTVSALTALSGILDSCDQPHEFEGYTDLGNTRTGLPYENMNPIQALLDPEEGFLKKYGAELVRDDFELYLLSRAGRNRGLRIEYGCNLLGVDYEINLENVVTAIKPVGETKDGKLLYLTDDPASAENYVLSPHAGEYLVKRCHVLTCNDCKVDGKQNTKALVRTRMTEQAQEMFEDECDLPDVSLSVQFILLGDTVEYAQYKDLDRLFLYDEVPVVDLRHGIEVQTDVHRVVVDCLTGRVLECELGNVRAGDASIYSWQIPSLNGSKLRPGTLPPTALPDGGIPENKLDPDLQEALNRAWADIESAQALLTDTRTWLDTVEATTETMQSAVTDNAGNITALRQTATEIRAGLTDAENNLAAVSLTASQLQTAMTNAQGDISTIRQSATEMSGTISNQAGQISSIRQDVSGVSSLVSNQAGQISAIQQDVSSITQTVSGAGGLTSQVQQLANRWAVELRDSSLGGTLVAQIGTSPTNASYRGLHLSYNGSNAGGMFTASGSGLMIGSNGTIVISSGSGGYVEIQPSGTADFGCSVNPTVGNQYTLGYDSGGRWKKIFLNNSPDVGSDRILKKDIARLNAHALLPKLKPRRYRLKADDAALHFGLVWQEVEEAVRGTDFMDAALLGNLDAEIHGLCYEELIAVLIEGWQRHEKEIAALRARIERLEVAHEHSD